MSQRSLANRILNVVLIVFSVWASSVFAADDERGESQTSPKEVVSATTGIKLVLIPDGEFDMGHLLTEKELALKFADWGAKEEFFTDERPPHRVKISHAFYIGRFEVTVGQFRKFVTDDGYKTDAETDGKGGNGWDETRSIFERDPKYTWKNPGFEQTDDHPVVNVSWNDAKKFCAWLSRKEGHQYRLPTEAQWEYACKAGRNTLWSNGDEPELVAKIGNIADGTAKAKIPFLEAIEANDGFVFTAPVGRFVPNAFGLYDMHGNVWEWCEDVFESKLYAGRTGTTVDPQQATGSDDRVLRGGSWLIQPRGTCSAFRYRNPPAERGDNVGFRISRNLQPLSVLLSLIWPLTLLPCSSQFLRVALPGVRVCLAKNLMSHSHIFRN